MKSCISFSHTLQIYVGWLLILASAYACGSHQKTQEQIRDAKSFTGNPGDNESSFSELPTGKELETILYNPEIIDKLLKKIARDDLGVKMRATINLVILQRSLSEVLLENQQHILPMPGLTNLEYGTPGWKLNLLQATVIHGYPKKVIHVLLNKDATIIKEDVYAVLRYGRDANAIAYLISQMSPEVIAEVGNDQKLINGFWKEDTSPLLPSDKLRVIKALVRGGMPTDNLLWETLSNPGHYSETDRKLLHQLIDSKQRITHEAKNRFLRYLAVWNINANAVKPLVDQLLVRGVSAEESFKYILEYAMADSTVMRYLVAQVDIQRIDQALQSKASQSSSILCVINSNALTTTEKIALINQLFARGADPNAKITAQQYSYLHRIAAAPLKEGNVALFQALQKSGVGSNVASSEGFKKELLTLLNQSSASGATKKELATLIDAIG